MNNMYDMFNPYEKNINCNVCCNGDVDLCCKYVHHENGCMKYKNFEKVVERTGGWMQKFDIVKGIVYFNGEIYLQSLNMTKDTTEVVRDYSNKFVNPMSIMSSLVEHERILYYDGSIYLETSEPASYNCRKLEDIKI